MRGIGRSRRAVSALLSAVLLLSQLLVFAAPAPACDRSLNADVLAHLGGSDINKVVVSGSYAYAAADGGLVVFAVSDPANPTVAAQLALPGVAEDIAVAGGYAYVVGDFGLAIVDVSAPATLEVVGGADWGGMHGVAMFDATHVLVTLGNEMKLIDVSDPAALDYRIIGGGAPSGNEYYDVAVSGTKVFVSFGTAPDAVKKIRMIDLANPDAPVTRGTYTVPGLQVSVRSIVASGSLVFAAEMVRGLEVVDFTTPTVPAQRGMYSVSGGYASDIAKEGPLVYLAVGDDGLNVLNVADPAAPAIAGTVDGSYSAVALDGAGKAYLAGAGALTIVSANPAAPATYGSVSLLPRDAKDVFFSDGYEYIAAGSDGLLKVRFDEVGGASIVGRGTLSDASKVVVTGDYAYVAENANIRVFDVSADTPVFVAGLPVAGAIEGMQIDGDRLYLAEGPGGLQVVNIHDRTHPAIVGTYHDPDSDIHAVAASGDRVYIGVDGGNVVSLDAANPAAISERDRMGTYGDVISLSLDGDLLYAGTTEKVYKCSAAQADDLFQIGHYYYFGKSVVAVKGAGNYAYAATEAGFYLVDFSDAVNPYVTMDFGDDAMAMGGVDAVNDAIFLAARDAGFFALRVPVFRTSGSSRYDTAVEMSKSNWDGADHVVLATGSNYADAACAAPLAHALGGPLLLVTPSGIPAGVTAEIQRLAANSGGMSNMHVVIVGSTKVVPSAVVSQLAGLGIPNDADHIKRLGGTDRYDTARMIAHEFKLAIAPSTVATAFVATGDNFPDALTVSGVAAAMDCPVLLTKRTYVPAPTQAALDDLGHPKLIAVGSKNVISDALYAQLGCVERLGGESRYDTAKLVAQYGLKHGFSDDELIVTTGNNFPDALVSGVVSAKHGCPIMLVNAGLPAQTANYISEHPNLSSITVVGSAKAISEEVENQIVDQLVY